jgi:hypothetical protein
MVFRGSVPTFNKLVEALRELGIDPNLVASMTMSGGRTRGIELWTKNAREGLYLSEKILAKGDEIALTLKVSWSWKRLEWTDHWNILIRGCPLGWTIANIKKGFEKAGLPVEGLTQIARPKTGDGRAGSNIILRDGKLPPEWIR